MGGASSTFANGMEVVYVFRLFPFCTSVKYLQQQRNRARPHRGVGLDRQRNIIPHAMQDHWALQNRGLMGIKNPPWPPECC